MSLDASALKNLYLWCKFQSCLLFTISLLLKNFLRALQALGLYIFVRDKRGQGLKTSTAHLYLTFPSVSPPGTSNDPSWMMVEKEQGMLANHKPELRNT